MLSKPWQRQKGSSFTNEPMTCPLKVTMVQRYELRESTDLSEESQISSPFYNFWVYHWLFSVGGLYRPFSLYIWYHNLQNSHGSANWYCQGKNNDGSVLSVVEGLVITHLHSMIKVHTHLLFHGIQAVAEGGVATLTVQVDQSQHSSSIPSLGHRADAVLSMISCLPKEHTCSQIQLCISLH